MEDTWWLAIGVAELTLESKYMDALTKDKEDVSE